MVSTDFLNNIHLLSIPEQIAKSIKQAIIVGKIPYGQPLPSQSTLADQFGVSRPTIKEAISYLLDYEIIEPISNRFGAYKVCDFPPEKISQNIYEIFNLSLISQTVTHQDLFELRKMIEIPAASLAALRRTEKELFDLEQCLNHKNWESLSVETLLHIDIQFHYLLCKSAHNPLSQAIMTSIIQITEERPPSIPMENKKYILQGLSELLEAIRQKNPTKASMEMEKHLYYAKKYIQAGQ